MNKIFLIGNLTRDPELNTVGSSNISVCRFSIAVNRKFTNKDGNRETDFFNITAWRGLGENCARFIKKGSKVSIVGEVQIRNYDDKDGNKRTAIDVAAEDIEFLDRLGRSQSNTESQNTQEAPPVGDEMKPVTDDSLPF
jgi:single-strand DNA-binding protein